MASAAARPSGGADDAKFGADGPVTVATAAMKKKTRALGAAKTVEEHRELLDSLSVPQIAALQSTFLRHSTEVAGMINAKQLGPLLRELGDTPSASELASLISMVDAEGNGLLDLEEFAALLAIRTSHQHSMREVREAINLFDTSGTGKIPKDEMAVILRDLAGMSPEDAEEALAVATAGQDDAEDFVDASALLDLLFSI